MDMGPDEIIEMLGLRPLPFEGGFYRETYRSGTRLESADRSLLTAIYYLLTPDSHSAIHRLTADELYHFYSGDPVEMLLLLEDGSSRLLVLGSELALGHNHQVLVPAGTWQGSRLRKGGRLALMGTTMAPGFDPADWQPGNPDGLVNRFPEWAGMIRELAPDSGGGKQ
ncbi:cupin domain-containing protein [Candidatus Fermentibacterales bacterium]|nr:cupin domain-containing protein [Candidatus Fermentibacterales bacterium]